MKQFPLSKLAYALPLLLLGACQQQSNEQLTPQQLNQAPASASWQNNDASINLSVSEQRGMQLSNASGDSKLTGEFDQLSVKAIDGNQWVAATLDERANSITIASFSKDKPLTQQLNWRLDKLQPDSLCLFNDANNRTLSLFVQDGASHAQQWLLAQHNQWLSTPQLMREINQPQNIAACAVDDNHGWLYTLEEGIGIWRLPARIETTAERTAVAMMQPWGDIFAEPKVITTDEQGNLFAIDEDGRRLMYWSVTDLNNTERSRKTPHSSMRLDGIATENLSATVADKQQTRLLINRDNGAVASLTLPSATSETEAVLPMVSANAETPPADRTGDVMDDPAIWVNTANPQQSRILGTHKKDGLYVYDLNAKFVARFGDGKLNNVDVRDGFDFNGETIGLAAASKREDNSLMFYGLRANGDVFRIGKLPTDLDPIYGLCMGKIDGKFYVFANDKTGRIDQYQITAHNGELQSKSIRRLTVASQPEGCAVDDARGRLFVGEEDVAVWSADVHENAKAEFSKVADVGPALVADIEGMEITSGEQPLLVVSSQGNDSYAVFDGIAPYQYHGSFRIGLDAKTGIDGASETDGLDVVSTPVGSQYPHGLLVVQDGRNRLPDAPQNFKYVDWNTVLKTLDIKGSSK